MRSAPSTAAKAEWFREDVLPAAGREAVQAAILRLGRSLCDDPSGLADLGLVARGYEAALSDLGQRDHVTLLPNRLRFLADVSEAGDLGGRCLVLVTLADARNYNELLRALGQGFGDAFVRTGASQVEAELPAASTLYHVSVLSFAVLLPDGVQAERLAQRVVAAFARPVRCDGLDIPTRIGVGLLDCPRGPVDGPLMLRAALAAAQDSRASSSGWARYNRGSDEAHRRTFHLVRDLSAALSADGQLGMRFQPRVRLQGGHCRSAEALLRWTHPTLGAISPAEFIPLAEATSLIEPVTEWVLDASLRQLADWRRRALPFSLSVNVSALNLRTPGFASHVAHSLERHGVDPHWLELEVTEGALAGDDESTSACLASLVDLGIELAIDDFGTGYSNMSQLARLPAEVLKIDRSLIQPLEEREKPRQLVRAIISTAHQLDYRVVAEGIETQETYDMLESWGCDEGQGFLMSRPLAAADFADWALQRA